MPAGDTKGVSHGLEELQQVGQGQTLIWQQGRQGQFRGALIHSAQHSLHALPVKLRIITKDRRSANCEIGLSEVIAGDIHMSNEITGTGNKNCRS